MEPQMHTDAHRSELELIEMTERIIGCAFKVPNELGCGFLEKVYGNTLAHELRKTGFVLEQQKKIPVYYDNGLVGDYCADTVVDGIVLLELKVVKAFDDIHKAHCMNYLKATGLPVCLPLNFGTTRLGLKRLFGPSHLSQI